VEGGRRWGRKGNGETAVVAGGRQAMFADIVFDDAANCIVGHAGFADANGCHPAVIRHLRHSACTSECARS